MLVTILGAGSMGGQLALLFAAHGIETRLWDYRNKEDMPQTLRRLALLNSKMGLIDKDDINSVCDRISYSGDINICHGSSFIIEAVKENYEIKSQIYRTLSQVVSPNTILASNTSTLSITGLAACTTNPACCLGIHFFNPPMHMKLVEVIRGEQTSDETISAAILLLGVLQKVAVVLPETPGFVVNRLLFPMINEAVFMLSEHVADAKTIDNCMKLGTNHPMGPLELADLIGLDVCLSILETLVNETGDNKYRPAALLKKYVRAGKLGKKSGVGFYQYRIKS